MSPTSTDHRYALGARTAAAMRMCRGYVRRMNTAPGVINYVIKLNGITHLPRRMSRCASLGGMMSPDIISPPISSHPVHPSAGGFGRTRTERRKKHLLNFTFFLYFHIITQLVEMFHVQCFAPISQKHIPCLQKLRQ